MLRITSTLPGYLGIVPSGTLPGGVGLDGAITTTGISGNCSNNACSVVDTLANATKMYPVQEPPSPLWNDELAYWPGGFVLTGNTENEGWQYVSRLYTDVLPYNGTPMISSYPGPGGVPSVYAQDCSGAPLIGSPMWISCLASDPVGGNRNNSGPTVLQNGSGGLFTAGTIPPMGRIIFEGSSLNLGQQDLITFGDSNQGVNLFSTSGFRPLANAGDCAISADNIPGSNWGLGFRCPTSISNYISQLPDGTHWGEQLLSSVKNFTVPLALYNGPITSTNKFGFTITVPTTTPPTARTLAIMDPGGPASFGLSLGSATINGPTSVSAGNCASSTKAIANVTTNNTLILTPQSSLSSYKGLAADAYVNAHRLSNAGGLQSDDGHD